MAHIFTPALRRPLSKPFARAGTRTIIQRAIASLRARGTDAHLWLPGGDVKTYGPELVTNGGFDTDSVWVKGNNTTISGGTLNILGGSTATTQPHTITSGQSFSVTYTITSVTTPDSGMRVRLGSTASGTLRTTAGTYSEILTATASGSSFVVEVPSLFVGSIDNISVREITSITPTITSGLTTGNYLESTGNTLATVDNPTGLVLDALGSVGTELVTNGDFSGPTSYFSDSVISGAGVIVGGQLNVSGPSAYSGVLGPLSYKTPNATIYAEATLVSGTGRFKFNFIGDEGAFPNIDRTGPYSFRGYAKLRSDGAFMPQLRTAVAGQTTVWDNISVREVSGIHLTQGTTANKPLLRRGLVNLLTYSKTVGGTSWALLGGLTSSGLVTAPDGTNTANTFLVSGSAYLQHNISGFASGASGTVAIWAKQSASGAANGIRLTTNNASAWSTGISQYFPLTPTWQLIVLSGVLQTGGASTTISYGAQLADASSDPNCYGNVDLVDAGCFLGTYTASQILAAGGIPVTTTAAASNPDAGKYSWAFDGSNDSLALGSVPFQMGDDWAVVAGVRSATPTAWATIFSIAGASANPRIKLFMNNSSGVFSAYLRDDSGNVVNPSGATDYRNTPAVVTLCKRGNNVYLRVNKVQVAASSTATIGTATFTASAIGADAFGGDIFVGDMYFISAAKGTFQDADLALEESLAASAAGITI